MRLIDDWRDAYKFWSVRVGAIGAVLMGTVAAWPDGAIILWNYMPIQVQTLLPERLLPIAGVALYVLVILSRVVKQAKLEKNNGQRKA